MFLVVQLLLELGLLDCCKLRLQSKHHSIAGNERFFSWLWLVVVLVLIYADGNFFRSSQNVPNGTNEAIKHKRAKEIFHFLDSVHTASKATKATNKTPCAQPMYFTPSGILNKYFKGIAMNKRSTKDHPSKMATRRNRLNVLSIAQSKSTTSAFEIG
jgi:hypothetical protein